MLNGRTRLAQWLKRSKLNQREMARLIGIHYTHLNQILSGRRTPGLANAVQIERITGISVEVWLASEVGESDRVDSTANGNALEGKA